MHTTLVILQVIVAVGLVGLILIQHGKGADAGAAFGSGASGTVFGARGASNFLSRTTAWLAAVFFASSLALAYWVSGRSVDSGSVVDRQAAPAVISTESPAAPAAPAVAPAATSAPAEQAPKVPE